MILDFHQLLHELFDPVPARRRQALSQLDEAPRQEINRFCDQAKDLELSLRLDLATVLAGTSVPALIDLLCHFATSHAATLRERAIDSLRQIRGSLQQDSIVRLLRAQDRKTRAAACRLLAESGIQAARDELVLRLEDPESTVVLAALDALDKLQMQSAVPSVEDLFSHADANVQVRAIEVAVQLTTAETFPQKAARDLLEEDTAATVKRAAAWSLGERPARGMETALAALLESKEPTEVCAAAADALRSYPVPEVAETLIRVSARGLQPTVALQCRRSLNRLPEVLIARVGESMRHHADPMVRFETASSLGALQFSGIKKLLAQMLIEEKDQMVQAATIEALGESGATESWSLLRGFIQKDPLLAYPTVNALAELLDHDHVEDFAAILAESENKTIQEAVLKRLDLFGRSNRLPAGIFELVHPFVTGPEPKLGLMAIQVMEAIDAPDRIPGLFQKSEAIEDETLKTALARTLLALSGNRTSILVDAAKETHLGMLTHIIEEVGAPGTRIPKALLSLASHAAGNMPGAKACLQALCKAHPQALDETLREANERESLALLQAWGEIQKGLRKRFPLPFKDLLSAASPQVRREALALVPDDAEDLIAPIVRLAMNESDPEIRRTAQAVVRKLVRE